MTKLQAVTRVGERLGDTSTGMLADLKNLFELVLDEMASFNAIRSLHQTNTFNFTTETRGYSTQTLSGLSAPNYPLDVTRVVVPAWGTEGWIERKEDEEFEWIRLANTQNDGTPNYYRPRYWRLYPNEQTIEFEPVPRSDDTADTAIISFIAPPAALGDNDEITEIRAADLPVIIAGMIKHGLVYADEVLVDRATAIREFELGVRRMRGNAQRERGRDRRVRNPDYLYTRTGMSRGWSGFWE